VTSIARIKRFVVMTDLSSNLIKGNLYRVSAWILTAISWTCVFILVFPVAIQRSPELAKQIDFSWMNLNVVIVLVIGAAMSIPARSFFLTSKRLTLLSGKQLMEKDQRAPVLYLRSFKDDEIMAKGPKPDLSEEEILARALAEIGPCIAIGKPGEKLPPLGMSRLYLTEGDWQPRVLDLMKKAGLVVMRAGSTEGLWEELKIAAQNIDPRKLVILLPFEPTDRLDIRPAPGEYAKFCLLADDILPKKLPSFFYGEKSANLSLTGVICFGEDWSSKIYCLSGDTWEMDKNLEQALNYYLKSPRKTFFS
jgi:hypothetical protein